MPFDENRRGGGALRELHEALGRGRRADSLGTPPESPYADGTLIIADETGGTLWRVTYEETPAATGAVPEDEAGEVPRDDAAQLTARLRPPLGAFPGGAPLDQPALPQPRPAPPGSGRPAP